MSKNTKLKKKKKRQSKVNNQTITTIKVPSKTNQKPQIFLND